MTYLRVVYISLKKIDIFFKEHKKTLSACHCLFISKYTYFKSVKVIHFGHLYFRKIRSASANITGITQIQLTVTFIENVFNFSKMNSSSHQTAKVITN